MNQDVDMQVVGMTQMAGTGASNGNNKKFFPKKFGGVSKYIMQFQNYMGQFTKRFFFSQNETCLCCCQEEACQLQAQENAIP